MSNFKWAETRGRNKQQLSALKLINQRYKNYNNVDKQ